MKDYAKYYDLNDYLFKEVSEKFKKMRYIDAFDFFCIIIWKANRAKTNMLRKIIKIAKIGDLDKICKEITTHLYKIESNEDKLRYLIHNWQFGIPMASAILTVLFPDEFTVYDVRVSKLLKKHENLTDKTNIDQLVAGYFEYLNDVKGLLPEEVSLREKDIYLWGESFFLELTQDIKDRFIRLDKKGKTKFLLDQLKLPKG